MYAHLLVAHSLLRWLVLACLLYAIFRAYTGYCRRRPFTKADNAVRHWTATAAHIQLMIGMVLYTQSPLVRFFWKQPGDGARYPDAGFYGLVHALLMLIAVVVLTIGSALARRRAEDRQKFRTMLVWFAVALLIIFLAIPWPFSPLSARPYFR